MAEKDKVIRGKFRLGENYFESLKEKRKKLQEDIQQIRKKTNERRAKYGYKETE